MSGADTVAVDNADGLVAPIYLVIDPDVPDKREWILVRAINGTVLENVLRGLEGSNGTPGQGIDHDTGAKVRSVPTKQIFDDIFADVEQVGTDLATHVADPGDPHAAAQYMKLTTGDQRYLNLVGGTMQGVIRMGSTPASGSKIANLAAGTQSGDAINWDQFQNAVAGGFDGDHDSLTNVVSSQHHVKYSDADAVNAMGPKSDNNDLNHDRYLDSDAVDAVAASGDFYTTAETYDKGEVDGLIAGLQSQITANAGAIGGKANSSHVHAAADTTTGAFLTARIPSLDAAKINTGTFSSARIPPLDAGKITTGILSVSRIPTLNANKISAGTFGAGNYTFQNLVGFGSIEVATTVQFLGLAINAGGASLRLVGTAVTRSA